MQPQVIDFSIVSADVDEILGRDLPWHLFHERTVLVTGGSGMLPAYVVDTLSCLKSRLGIRCRVLASVRDRDRAQSRLSFALEQSTLEVIDYDLMDAANLAHSVDFIVHGASPASPLIYIERPLETISANTVITLELLKLSQKNRLQGFLYLSSAEIYGMREEYANTPIAENDYGMVDPVAPRSCYAEAKRLGEAICVGARRELGLNTQIARIFHTYGPGLRFDDDRIFARLVGRVVEGRPLELSSDGTAVRAFCYVTDAVVAFMHILLKGDGHPYNVGNPAECYSMSELAGLLAKLFPDRTSFAPPAWGQHQSPTSRFVPDVGRVKALGWEPATSVPLGFQRTVWSYL